MRKRHSFPRALAYGLVVVCLIGAQQACQPADQEQMSVQAHTDAGQIHWAYDGETGAASWGELDPSFAVCASGVQQSPVDLADAIPADGDGLNIQWQPGEAHVRDTGHTIQVDMAEGSSIILEGRRFSLLQFHFHGPSEHTVEGGSFPMEVHFVHQAEEGDLAVIGVFVGDGDGHSAIESIWEAIPDPGGSPATLAELDPRTLVPTGRGYYRYAGSLTTPPCSEVVNWVVMTEPTSVSSAQVDAFSALYPMNARPVQPLNRRFIVLRP